MVHSGLNEHILLRDVSLTRKTYTLCQVPVSHVHDMSVELTGWIAPTISLCCVLS